MATAPRSHNQVKPKTFSYEQSEEILLTLREACQILKCHPNTLRKWDKNGVFIAIRFGARRDRRYKKDAVMKLIDQMGSKL